MPDSEYDRLRAVSPEWAEVARSATAGAEDDKARNRLSRRLRELLEDQKLLNVIVQDLNPHDLARYTAAAQSGAIP